MDREEKTEEQLATELEDMYKRVASVEKLRDGATDDMTAQHGNLTANASDDEEQFAGEIQSYQQKKELLSTVADDADTQADEILAYQHHQEALARAAGASIPKTAESQAAAAPPDPLPSPAPKSRRLTISAPVAVVIAMLGVLLFGAFIWPTPYEVSSVTKNGKTYPLRINRATGSIAYFDGVAWLTSPIPDASSLQSTAKVTKTEPPVSMPVAAVPVPAPPPAVPRTAVREKQTAPDQPKSAAPAVITTETRASAARPAIKPPGGTEPATRLFSIQIKSFDNSKEAQKLVAELKSPEVEVFSIAAPMGGQGTWHRVLIGRFKNPQEALQFMHKHKIRTFYPDSFVQKLSP